MTKRLRVLFLLSLWEISVVSIIQGSELNCVFLSFFLQLGVVIGCEVTHCGSLLQLSDVQCYELTLLWEFLGYEVALRVLWKFLAVECYSSE